jgi:beta-glucosidase-like glycosyl hydrolase
VRLAAELLVPRVPWDARAGFAPTAAFVERALALGVGGFVLDGGTPDAVLAWVRQVRRAAKVPLLIGAEGRRGAGEVFAGATGLPPYAAIGALDDDDAVRRAARLTAREARTAGVNWVLAPSADLDAAPPHGVLGPDTFGRDPEQVARAVNAWVTACQAEGVLACVRHFPGLGRAMTHPDLGAPELLGSVRDWEQDLRPFRAALSAGTATLLVGHAVAPALDPGKVPADQSAPIMRELLRNEMGFDGMVVTAATANPAMRAQVGEALAAVRSVAAGADLLLGVTDLEAVADALDAALQDGRLDADLVEQSRRRRRKWAQWATPPSDFLRPAAADLQWGSALADRAVHVVHGREAAVRAPVDVVVVDDRPNAGGSGVVEPLLSALREAGVSAREVPRPVPGSRGTVVVALMGGWDPMQSRARYRPDAVQAVARAVQDAGAAGRPAVVAQFGPPGLAAQVATADATPVLCAWTGDAAMQQAVARWLATRRRTA